MPAAEHALLHCAGATAFSLFVDGESGCSSRCHIGKKCSLWLNFSFLPYHHREHRAHRGNVWLIRRGTALSLRSPLSVLSVRSCARITRATTFPLIVDSCLLMGNLSRGNWDVVADVISALGAGNATVCALEETLLRMRPAGKQQPTTQQPNNSTTRQLAVPRPPATDHRPPASAVRPPYPLFACSGGYGMGVDDLDSSRPLCSGVLQAGRVPARRTLGRDVLISPSEQRCDVLMLQRYDCTLKWLWDEMGERL